jgi:hypothetical protein
MGEYRSGINDPSLRIPTSLAYQQLLSSRELGALAVYATPVLLTLY